jgi:hypothetical protein
MGNKGTGAGKEVRGVPAASGVGGDIPKRWLRVHIKREQKLL